MSQMVKPGYKQTEVGVIPEEWEVKDVADLVDPGTPICYGVVQVGRYTESGVPIVAIKYVKEIAYAPLHRTAAVLEKPYARSRPKGGDVLISIKGTIGRVGIVPDGFCGNISRELARLRISGDTSPEFIAHQLEADATQDRIMRSVVGTTRLEFSIATLRQFSLPFPPTIEEQRAIATALSDVDALLAALDRLIAKQRDLKQAAMQQLLTGQTRLPGFTGKWETKRLGDLGATYGGLTGKTKADFGDGSAHYISFMNVMTNVVINCGEFERVKVSPTESQNRVTKGDLLFNGSSETPEEVAMCAVMMGDVPDLFLNSFCFGFRFRERAKADGLFLAYYLRSKEGRELMKSLAQGSTRYNLSKVALLNSPLLLPPLPEQTAIATVLSDMDLELAALEQRRDKTRALKQGMMQELLTGRTRLL